MKILTSGCTALINMDLTSLIYIEEEREDAFAVVVQTCGKRENLVIGRYATESEAKVILNDILCCSAPFFRMPPNTSDFDW